jgi:hypothetical protein
MEISIYVNDGTMNGTYYVRDEQEQRRVKSDLEAGRHPGITQCAVNYGTAYVNLSENVSYSVVIQDIGENDGRAIGTTDRNAAPYVRF